MNTLSSQDTLLRYLWSLNYKIRSTKSFVACTGSSNWMEFSLNLGIER